MADIIDLSSRFKPGHNLIAMSPLEFRKGEWLSGKRYFVHAGRICKTGSPAPEDNPGQAPYNACPKSYYPGRRLSLHKSLWLFRFREDESRMRRLYRLAGLMECVTKAPSPVLRTDLVRRFFKIINEEREQLNVSWKGNVRNFLLPLHAEHYKPGVFIDTISSAPSLKDLLAGIEKETDSQFDILANSYVFYVPETFLPR